MIPFGRRLPIVPEATPPLVATEPAPAVAAPVVPASPPQPRKDNSPDKDYIRDQVLQRIEPSVAVRMTQEDLTVRVNLLVAEIATERRLLLNRQEQHDLGHEIVDDMVGLGPLEPLLRDDTVSDILINGARMIYVERRGKLELTNLQFRNDAHVMHVAQRIASSVGRRIDESSPMLDARLKDGSRVNVVIPPLSVTGPCISIRKFSRVTMDFPRLIKFGTVSPALARALEIAARCRLNIVVSGGTGSGKTTLMNAMSRMIGLGERVVTVEDAAELQLQQPHVVRLETRPASLEGRGEITQRDLVRNALRMRPDRIIIGEVRGAEAFDMLQAMNTGHDGSMSTIHANNTRDALTRIENMVQMGNMGLPSKAIRTQIVGAVDMIVQVERQRDGGRRVTQVSEICGMEGEIVTMNTVFEFEVLGEGRDGRLQGTYKVSHVPPSFLQRLAYFGMDKAWHAAMEAAKS